MSTLATVEMVLRQTKSPMSVSDIVDMAGDALPSRSKTPDTVVARDLSMSIKRLGDESRFVRTAPGRYTLREYVTSGHIKMGDCGLRALSLRHQISSECSAHPENTSGSTSPGESAPLADGDTTSMVESSLREGPQGLLSPTASRDVDIESAPSGSALAHND